MESLRYFTKEGAKYTLKKQTNRILLIAGLCFAVGIYALVGRHLPMPAACMFLFGLIVLYRFSGKVVFDTEKRAVIQKRGAFGGTRELPFDSFVNFAMTKTKQAATNITTNTQLRMIFEVNGRQQEVKLREAGRNTEYADRIMAEIERIMKPEA